MTLQTALGYVPSNPNLIINGGFTVNQRGYATGTSNAAGVFAHDRWKAGAAGGAYSFTQLDSPTTITITAGTFIQVVETKNVQGGSYVLSWTGTATARYGLNSATPSGSYVASPILITGQTAATAISVEFGTGTLGTIKLETGTVATPFVHTPYAEELVACLRYATKLSGTSIGGIGVRYGTASCTTIVVLPVPMRSTPTMTTSTPTWVASQPSSGNKVGFFNYTGNAWAEVVGDITPAATAFTTRVDRFQFGFAAATSMSGTAGDSGVIMLGSTAWVLLSSEL